MTYRKDELNEHLDRLTALAKRQMTEAAAGLQATGTAKKTETSTLKKMRDEAADALASADELRQFISAA